MSAMRSFVSGMAGARSILGLVVGSGSLPAAVEEPQAAAGSLHFTASGDFAARTETAAVLSQIGSIAPDLHVALGDLSYGATGAEQAWCDFVTTRVGVGFPFELLAGNHESNGQNGDINDFSACLPNQLPGLVGTYGRQYYEDVPREVPLVRFVMISPALPFSDGTWSYAAGSLRYAWTFSAIDGARAAGVPWVVVGMHKPCLSVGQYGCEPGADLLGLLASKRVDLVLSGHEPGYARSHQLAQSAACTAVVPGTYSATCVADSDSTMAKGAGTVFAIVGTGGVSLRDVSAADTEARYFAASSGLNSNPTYGNLEFQVTPDSLTATFRRAIGGTFTDSFSITAGPPVENVPPTASFTGSCVDLACSFDGSASADPDGLISSYEWDYGDGTIGTGVTSNHAYAGAGTYQVALRVTYNSGASASTTRPQSPTAPPPVTTIAADAFARTLSNGFGPADTGGPWTLDGGVSKYSVDGSGRIILATAGGSAGAYLNQVSALFTNLQFTLTTDKNPTGGGIYATVSGRRTTGAGDYQAKVVLRSGGGVALSLVRRIGATETAISPGIALPRLAFAGGDRLKVRMEVFGSSPTTVRAKVWKVGTVEPVAWQRSVTDSTAGFQSAGGVGLNVYMSSTSTNAPVVVRIDDLDARVP